MLSQEIAPTLIQEIDREIDRETERYLSDILAQESMTAGELIRSLIRDRWMALSLDACESSQSVAVMAVVTTARRPTSKQIIAEFLHRKCRAPH